MHASLTTLTSHKKSTLLTGVVEHFIDEEFMNDFTETGWYAIESGSRGEIEEVELIKAGCEDCDIPDYYMVEEDDEFKSIDNYNSHIEIGHAEELGFAIMHVTVD